jgi:hypothetical protein
MNKKGDWSISPEILLRIGLAAVVLVFCFTLAFRNPTIAYAGGVASSNLNEMVNMLETSADGEKKLHQLGFSGQYLMGFSSGEKYLPLEDGSAVEKPYDEPACNSGACICLCELKDCKAAETRYCKVVKGVDLITSNEFSGNNLGRAEGGAFKLAVNGKSLKTKCVSMTRNMNVLTVSDDCETGK